MKLANSMKQHPPYFVLSYDWLSCFYGAWRFVIHRFLLLDRGHGSLISTPRM